MTSNDCIAGIDSIDCIRYAGSMASLTIRKLDDSVKTKLRVRAAENGRSMEEEARAILEEAVQVQAPSAALGKPRRSFYHSIRRSWPMQAWVRAGYSTRAGPMRALPDFSGPEFRASDDE